MRAEPYLEREQAAREQVRDTEGGCHIELSLTDTSETKTARTTTIRAQISLSAKDKMTENHEKLTDAWKLLGEPISPFPRPIGSWVPRKEHEEPLCDKRGLPALVIETRTSEGLNEVNTRSYVMCESLQQCQVEAEWACINMLRAYFCDMGAVVDPMRAALRLCETTRDMARTIRRHQVMSSKRKVNQRRT